jgi:hypothetical protein
LQQRLGLLFVNISVGGVLAETRRKGGKEHEMPVHHLLEQILNEYIVATGLQTDNPCFRA